MEVKEQATEIVGNGFAELSDILGVIADLKKACGDMIVWRASTAILYAQPPGTLFGVTAGSLARVDGVAPRCPALQGSCSFG